jgi:3-methyladenine DNA glycosylase AlkD
MNQGEKDLTHSIMLSSSMAFRYSQSMTLKEIVTFLKANRNESNLAGMARYGISMTQTFGISMPMLRRLAKTIGTDHRTAIELYRTGIHEAKILAALVDDPARVTRKQMEEWVKGFDSWDVTDQVCTILFDGTEYAWKKAVEWTRRRSEYEKRAAYAVMAGLAVHDTTSPDRDFEDLYPYIISGAEDERIYVKKAVNWALRNIGKRSSALNESAIHVAESLIQSRSGSARWIASDALRELKGETAKKRVKVNERKLSHEQVALMEKRAPGQ